MFFKRRYFRRRLLIVTSLLGICGFILMLKQVNSAPGAEVRKLHHIIHELQRKLDGSQVVREQVEKGYFLGLNHTNKEQIINRNGHKPRILIWNREATNYFANPEECGGYIDCHITSDRELLDSSDAVLFYSPFDIGILPKQRRQDQLFVWWAEEKNHREIMTEFDYVFNLTFTYRRDSSIYAPYGSMNHLLEELRRANEIDIDELLQRKRKSGKIAAWAVSNCHVPQRMWLMEYLQEAGLVVDGYGKCFGDRQIGKGRYDKTFYDALSEYKFYLAFENGYHCKDYITEKFWYNGLRAGSVPIVWGATKDDVAAVAPEHSFIHVDDFKNLTVLVDYLKHLIDDENAYKKHLEWRRWIKNPNLMEERLRPEHWDNDLRGFCKLCRILQEERQAERLGKRRRKMLVPSLREFWWDENKECLRY